jgi:hypothetical protein
MNGIVKFLTIHSILWVSEVLIASAILAIISSDLIGGFEMSFLFNFYRLITYYVVFLIYSDAFLASQRKFFTKNKVAVFAVFNFIIYFLFLTILYLFNFPEELIFNEINIVVVITTLVSPSILVLIPRFKRLIINY